MSKNKNYNESEALAALIRVDELEKSRPTLGPAHAQYAATKRKYGGRRIAALAQTHGLATRTRKRAIRFGTNFIEFYRIRRAR